MKYKITIEELIETEDQRYPNKIEIYNQIVENAPIIEIIKFINGGVSS